MVFFGLACLKLNWIWSETRQHLGIVVVSLLLFFVDFFWNFVLPCTFFRLLLNLIWYNQLRVFNEVEKKVVLDWIKKLLKSCWIFVCLLDLVFWFWCACFEYIEERKNRIVFLISILKFEVGDAKNVTTWKNKRYKSVLQSWGVKVFFWCGTTITFAPSLRLLIFYRRRCRVSVKGSERRKRRKEGKGVGWFFKKKVIKLWKILAGEIDLAVSQTDS